MSLSSIINILDPDAFVFGGGVSNEIMGFINQINSRYEKVNVILTGGDAKILSKTLKITIFANQNFILEGLNCILNLNKN